MEGKDLIERKEAGLPQDSLVGDAYRKLREGIWSFAYAPGAVLSDFVLAKELGISRTPIREALCLLADDGLVRRRGEGGFEVTVITLEETDDLFDARLALEEAMLQASFRRGISQKLADGLRYQDGKLLESLQKGDRASAWAFDMRFHHTLAIACGNRHLLSFFDRIEKQLKRIVPLLEGTDFSWREQSHHDIIGSLEREDFPACRKALEDDISHDKRQYRCVWEKHHATHEVWWVWSRQMQDIRH